MAACFAMIVYRFASTPDMNEYALSFASSLFYLHNVFWPRDVLPLVNPVAWSLEIEVQFYLLAPVLALVFRIPSRWRAGLLTAFIIAYPLLLPTLPHRTILDYLHFFLAGFLVAEMYVRSALEPTTHSVIPALAALASLTAIWFVPFEYSCVPISLFIILSLKSHWVRHHGFLFQVRK
jgi:peptidoglycan/LPS O-acetylase OafA/YrhL